MSTKRVQCIQVCIRTRSTKLSFDELATMLKAEEESFNEGMEIKDSTFAMAVNSTPRFNNIGGGFNKYNQSHNNKGKGRGNNARGRGRGPSSS